MKFLKVLSTSAIAAALIASMSVTAFAAEETEFDENDLAEEFAGDADLDDLDENEFTFDEGDEETGDLEDEFSGLEEEEEEDEKDVTTGTAADADCFAPDTYKPSSDFSWVYSDDFWETEFAPASVNGTYTLFDVVKCAQASGVNALNIQSLSNFLMLNEEHFKSDDYADFIRVCTALKEEIIDEHVNAMWPGKTAGELEDSDRYVLYNSLTRDEKDAISAALINVANRHGVLVSFDTDVNGYPVIYASMRSKIAATETSSSTNTQTGTGSPVAATGGDLPETGSAGAAVFAGISLALAAVGVVLVARKNNA